MRGNAASAGYSKHARLWDLLHGDRMDEVEFWAKLAQRYGRRVLAPMAASGSVALGLARRGFEVVALECCPEMVELANVKGAELDNFICWEGDLAELAQHSERFDFVFVGGAEYHHLESEGEQAAVLGGLCCVLRPQGGLALEMMTFSTTEVHPHPSQLPKLPKGRHPRFAVESDLHLSPDAHHLTVHQHWIEKKAGHTEDEEFDVPLRMFTRVELMVSLAETGFRRVAEFGDYDLRPHVAGSPKWIVLAEKRTGC